MTKMGAAPLRPSGQDISNSTHLRRRLALAESWLDKAARDLWTSPALGSIFPEFLILLYGSMRSTVPLLRFGAECARSLGPGDALARQLASYYGRHAEEELHHDEWLLADMEAIGMRPEEVQARVPPASVADMVGAQYYWAAHAHPLALIGYLLVLEGNPPDAGQLAEIQRRHGIPREGLRTLLKHASVDPQHAADLRDLTDALPLRQQDLSLITMSAWHTIEKVCEGCSALLDAPRMPGE
jgi:hypothetical protein